MMNDYRESKEMVSNIAQEKIIQSRKHRGPGRGVGEKRIAQERIDELESIFSNLENLRHFLSQEGHIIINASGTLLASQSHQNLDQLLILLEDFLWVLNCAIAKKGGQPKLF